MFYVFVAGGVLSGLEFSDISQPVDCQTCNEKIQLIDLQKHLTDHHAYVDNEVTSTCLFIDNKSIYMLTRLAINHG